jgi:glycosyltransferase involved in cell wall biosynthesis
MDPRVRREADALAHAGYEVTVVCPTAVYAAERCVTLGRVRVLRFDAPTAGHGVVGYMREYLLAIARIGQILLRLRKEAPFSAVIACNPPDFLILLPRLLAREAPGLVFDYHDLSPELFEETFARRGPIFHLLLGLERFALRTADVVMTVNEPCARLVRDRGKIPGNRVFVVGNCPDPRSFFQVEPRPELRNGREQLVLWVGRMSGRAARREGLRILVEAAAELVNHRGRTNVAFALVGGGEVRDEVAQEIKRLGLEGVVHLPGELNVDSLRDYIATADICVSLDTRSPMTDQALVVKVLEYMIMAKPVVQSPLAEMRRICGDTTLYVRDGDAHDVGERIGELLDDPDRRASLGRAARERVLDGLTWPDQVPTLLRAVEQASPGRRGHRREPERTL